MQIRDPSTGYDLALFGYLTGLLLDGERKTVVSMASRR
jgi:hypothetical protein